MKKRLIFMTLLSLAVLSACNQSNESNQEKTQSVAASMYPIEFLISEIAKDHVEVQTVVPPGTDPHVYEPSSKKMIELADHDAFFYIGDEMEAFGETLANAVSGEGVDVFQLSDYESLFESAEDDHHEHEHESHEHNHEHDHDHDHHGHSHDYNPHFWIDPVRMSQAAEIVSEDLTQLYPAHADTFEANLEELQANLDELDQSFSTLKQEDYVLFVTHEAFSYWTERYGVEQLSVRGVSSSQEPSQKQLKEIFDEVSKLDIDHIILETNSQDRLAQTIATEMNLRELYIHTLESLTEENIEQQQDYFDLMYENLDVIQETIKY